MLFIPIIEKRGNTAAVLLDNPHTFADGLDLDTAHEIANALSDRFEIYAIKNNAGFIVMVYDNAECVETVKVESWGEALDVVARRSADLRPEDSPEGSEGAEDSPNNARASSRTFAVSIDHSQPEFMPRFSVLTPIRLRAFFTAPSLRPAARVALSTSLAGALPPLAMR